MTSARPYSLVRLSPDASMQIDREVADECPVAIEYNGIGYAVMMATPADLADYAIGFSLSEGLATARTDIRDVEVFATDGGIVVRIAIAEPCMAAVIERARLRVSESSCGLCGLDSIAQVLRPLNPIKSPLRVSPASLFTAIEALRHEQPLNRRTGSAHAAAFCDADGQVRLVREDVGRHNALDKLIGALASEELEPATGFFLLTARCSYELVEKTIRAGCPLLVTISAPTTLAIDRARMHGLTLVTLARRDAMLVASDPHGLFLT